MKVLSLFDGISCGMVALERAGIAVDRYVAYEYDEETADENKGFPFGYAASISKRHYPTIEHRGNVCKADFSEFFGFDFLIGGSPCQGFSFAGKQLNFEDPRSKLFFEFVRALNEAKPRYFLFENTPMKKEYVEVISRCFGFEPTMINSNLVSAQDRKRLYWVGKRNADGTYSKIQIEMPEDKGIFLEDVVEPDALVDRDKSHAIIASVGRTTHREYFKKYQNQMVFLAVELSNIYGGFKEKKPRIHLRKSATIRAGQGGGHIPSLVIEGKAKDFTLENFKKCIRKVTPLECERLQTLPDNYTEGLSPTQRYKAIGNGWTVDVIAHIFTEIKRGEKMSYTDDPVKDFLIHDSKQQEWLDRLPHCAHCHNPIQDEDYYEIEGANICSDCLYEYCEEQYKKVNTELEY